jgi:ubiquinone biosynthesis accessory factor UbiJ
MFTAPAVATVNHLIAQSGWAQARLQRFAGKTAQFDVPPFVFSCTVKPDGLLQEAARNASCDAELTLPPTLLPRLALDDEDAFSGIEAQGDAAFIEEIVFLLKNLKWDAAEDISRVTGDVAAERIVGFARAGSREIRNIALNLSGALAEYWTEERPLIAKPHDLSEFARSVARLNEDLARLEARVEKLTR